MSRTVTNTKGEEIEVVTLADLLDSERALRKWVVGSFLTIVLTAVSLGVLYGKMVSDITRIGTRVEEIRLEGSLPVQAVQRRLDLIVERQNLNTTNIGTITTLMAEHQRLLLRIDGQLAHHMGKR